MKLVVWVCLGLCCWVQIGFAADRFVSRNGNDLQGLNDCRERARPCQTIRQAIEHAAAGDTIRVLAGASYPECGLTVEKRLKILSEGGRAVLEPDMALDDSPQEGKVCQGVGFVFKLSGKQAAGSWLEGFTMRAQIKKTRGENKGALVIVEETENVVIKGNSMTVKKAPGDDEAGVGLLILNSSFVQIEENEITGSLSPKNEEGIRLQGGRGNVVKSNRLLKHGGGGLSVLDAIAPEREKNRFVGNRVEENGGAGMQFLNSSGLQIGGESLADRNHVMRNQGLGLLFRSPCEGKECKSIEIINNLLSGNSQGISFEGPPLEDARFQDMLIVKNTIQGHKEEGLNLALGVYAALSLRENILDNNQKAGLQLEARRDSSLEVSQNTVRFNTGSGIHITVRGQVAKLEIISNVLTNNKNGLVLKLEGAVQGLNLSQNAASQNTESGIEISGGALDNSDPKNRIVKNIANGNGKAGLHIQGDYYIIAENESRSNLVGLHLGALTLDEQGQTQEEKSSNHNAVLNNVLSHNRCAGLEIIGRNNKIIKNSASLNGLNCPTRGFDEGTAAGILLRGKSESNELLFNTVDGNRNGISLLRISPLDSRAPEGNQFSCNTITRNFRGIQVLPSDSQSPIKDRFYRNDIERNTEVGLRNFAPAATIEARENWWGDPSGPFHPQLNPNGKGDRILGPVDFAPYLRTRALGSSSCRP